MHHLANVMRQKPGDEINLNSGKGWLGKGRIISINRSEAVVDIIEIIFHPVPGPAFAIAFSLLRGKHDELLVEKVTELGAADLFPILTEHSVRHVSANTLSKFQAAALAAIKQCDNPWLPMIHPITELEQAIGLISQSGYEPILASEQLPGQRLDSLAAGKCYCFLIGPEGGFSPKEFQLMKELGIIEVSISENILRAETAAIAAAAQFSLLRKQ